MKPELWIVGVRYKIDMADEMTRWSVHHGTADEMTRVYERLERDPVVASIFKARVTHWKTDEELRVLNG